MEPMKNNILNPAGTLHYRYCLLILTLIVIAIASDRWTEKDGFTDYLSNAATLTSLLLGLVAIFYSFISNSSISSSLGSITSVSSDVERINKQIGEYVSLAKDIESAGRDNVNSLGTISSEMNQGLKEFACLLKSMDEKNSAMHDLISNLPGKLDDLEEKFTQAASNEKQKTPNETNTRALVSDKSIIRLFDRSSFYEIFIVYCCVEAWKSTKIIDPKEICEVVEIHQRTKEAESFIRCLDAIGAIEVFTEDKEENIYHISRINNYLLNNARDLTIKEMKKNLTDDVAYSIWDKTLTDVEEYYSAKKTAEDKKQTVETIAMQKIEQEETTS